MVAVARPRNRYDHIGLGVEPCYSNLSRGRAYASADVMQQLASKQVATEQRVVRQEEDARGIAVVEHRLFMPARDAERVRDCRNGRRRLGHQDMPKFNITKSNLRDP